MKRLLLSTLLLAGSLTAASAQLLDVQVAVVRLTETANIGRREVNQQLSVFTEQLGRELTAGEKQEILDALINDRLLLQGANRAGVRVTQTEIDNYVMLQRQQFSQAVGTVLTEEQFRLQVERQTGSSWSDYLRDVTNELRKIKYVRQAKAGFFERLGSPSDDEVRQFYDERATSFTNPAMVSFRHVYIDLRGKSEEERQRARTLLDGFRRRIQNGTLTFDQLVEQSLDDPTYTAADFGYLLRTDQRNSQPLGTRFVNAVFALDKVEVGGVLESNVALHIVRITDKRAARILELDDPILPGQTVTVRQQIRGLLAAQREQEALAAAVEALVTDLRQEAEITLFRQNLPW